MNGFSIFSIISLIGGLAFFLFGMHVMSTSLEKMAGGKLELLLKKMTAKPIMGLALGATITMAIQSSSATTVMLVGLVNSGIMAFSQTISVIFGANIGTTMTSWLLSLSGIESENILMQLLKPENFSPLIAFVGIIMIMVCKGDRKKSIGSVLVGFAILMSGMDLMKNAISPLSELDAFKEMMVGFDNPLIGVLVGAFITALIQSSSASVGILQALSLTGLVSYGMAIPIVMGQNIGTCITSVISSFGVNKNAKRVAVLHVTINTVGTIICMVIFLLVKALVNVELLEATVSPISIAVIHTVFNVALTLFLFPFSKLLEKLVVLLVPNGENGQDGKGGAVKELFLDPRLLATPSIALGECEHKSVEMATLSKQSIFDAIALFQNFTEKEASQIRLDEDVIDRYEDKLGSYLVQLSGRDLSAEDTNRIAKILHSIGDFERLGDHALNLMFAAKEIAEKKMKFSTHALAELEILTLALSEILTNAVGAFISGDTMMAKRVEPLEQVIDDLLETVKLHHVQRLQGGRCTIELGFVLADIMTNYERISDHCSNIAVCVIETSHSSFDTHKYLNKAKNGENFEKEFMMYKEKYALPEHES